MKQLADSILAPAARLAYERGGLTPNAISVISFLIGLVAAGLAADGHLAWGMAVMAIAQIVDGLDGAVARRYGLQSRFGRLLDILFDRLSELAMFVALVAAGEAGLRTALLAFVAILVLTAVEPYSHFDPGFKRFVLYFGWLASVLAGVRGFELSLHLIFLANIAAAAAGMVIAEYRLQEQVDAQAIVQRERERALGLPPPPDDPPSLLSRLASWL